MEKSYTLLVYGFLASFDRFYLQMQDIILSHEENACWLQHPTWQG